MVDLSVFPSKNKNVEYPMELQENKGLVWNWMGKGLNKCYKQGRSGKGNSVVMDCSPFILLIRLLCVVPFKARRKTQFSNLDFIVKNKYT